MNNIRPITKKKSAKLAILGPKGLINFGILSRSESLGIPIKSVAHPKKNNSVLLPNAPAQYKATPMARRLVESLFLPPLYLAVLNYYQAHS